MEEYVYIILLKNNKYFIDKTTNFEKKIEEIKSSKNCFLFFKNPFVKLISIIPVNNNLEDIIAEIREKYSKKNIHTKTLNIFENCTKNEKNPERKLIEIFRNPGSIPPKRNNLSFLNISREIMPKIKIFQPGFDDRFKARKNVCIRCGRYNHEIINCRYHIDIKGRFLF